MKITLINFFWSWFHVKSGWQNNYEYCCFLQVWKLRNFTATIFSQKFREIKFLLKSFTLSWFDEKKNLHGSEFLVYPHCETRRLPFLRKNQNFFRQINDFTKEVTKELISRKILIAFYSTFPHCNFGSSILRKNQ